MAHHASTTAGAVPDVFPVPRITACHVIQAGYAAAQCHLLANCISAGAERFERTLQQSSVPVVHFPPVAFDLVSFHQPLWPKNNLPSKAVDEGTDQALDRPGAIRARAVVNSRRNIFVDTN